MTQHAIELGDILASIPGFWASWQDFRKSKGDGASFGGFVKERLPDFLGISKVDEAIYARLWSELETDERTSLTALYAKMRDYEVDCLRLVIANMQPPVQKVTKTAATSGRGGGQGQPAKEEITFGDDPKLKFLKALAKEVKSQGAKRALSELRANRFTIKDPASHRLYLMWLTFVKWTKRNILDFFGVKNLRNITLKMVAQRINVLARIAPYRRSADMNLGFWVSAFQHHPVLAGVLALGALGFAVYSIFI